MLRSLSSRLLVAFAFVIVLSLALSAVGTLFLLRDRQRDAAEERVGRLAEPLTLAVALLEEAGVDDAAVHNAVNDYALSFDVRVLLVNEQGRVVADTDGSLTGDTIDVFVEGDVPVTRRGSAQFRMAKWGAGGEELFVFAPARESLQLSPNRLIQLQQVIYELSASSTSPEVLDDLLATIAGEQGPRTIALPELRPLVAVTEEQITSAWQDLVPQFLIAGGIALLASAGVAALISRSISGRLGRLTQAAQEMARGNYDQRVDPRGEDEVGRLAGAFNVMARQVSRSHSMMRDLLANVSHELRTPLTSIQGFSQAMEEGAISSPEEYREAGRIINQETLRMRQLVEDLIELSRIESGQIVMQREPVDLEHLLRDCARRFDWQLRDSGAGLQLELPQLPAIEGDGRRLEQAFSNLIENAVRHTPRGGAISVRASADNGVVRVAVHNTGSFIPPDELPRVFERFFQLERHRSRGGVGGAGLGLAIASEVVQAHRGDLSASSDRERGTEFVVTLPVTGKPPARSDRPAKES
jgi:signal transduction histidine kinase